MPPKPMELMKGSGVEFYNIDFSLQNQLRLAGASVPQSLQDQVKELMEGFGVEFYNIDFSLQNQLRLAGASVP